ncbi:MAG: hypothetical protein Q4F49_02360 [Pseudoxanthomonas suwonensis]|nr:hypothetical protein [Pseudoxanthomonas suwonensis]
MTLPRALSKTCACCGKTTRIAVLASTGAYGSMDLDMRPPGLMRHALRYQIHRCGHCGLCVPNLEEVNGVDLPTVVRSTRYRAILENDDLPELAREFMAFAHVCELAGWGRAMVRSTLSAAWLCDDQQKVAQARLLRKSILPMLDDLHARGEHYSNEREIDDVLRLDLLRRTGQFDQVKEAAAALMEKLDGESVHWKIARFQIALAGERDVRRYRLGEALEQTIRPMPLWQRLRAFMGSAMID